MGTGSISVREHELVPDPAVEGSRSYGHVARAVLDTPWAIREQEGRIVSAIIRGRLAGERIPVAEIEGRIEAARAGQGPRNGPPNSGPVAIVPIYGVIMPRANLMTALSGGTTVGQIQGMLADALADDEVAAVIAEFDSPGGSVEGIPELASWINAQRGQKPMVAVVNTMCCSAAYWLAAQFDEIVASPSALTGSIGVFTEHDDVSAANEMEGIKVTYIRQPATKNDTNSDEPLSDDAAAHLQSLVDDFYGQFVGSVAKGRGISVSDVRDGYGQGRELTSTRAKAAGLVDRVDTLDATARRLSSGQGRAAMQRSNGAASGQDITTAPEPQEAPTRAAWQLRGQARLAKTRAQFAQDLMGESNG